MDEVQKLGRATGSTRLPDQEQAAWFWANDLDGTYKPPGQLIEHTRLVAETQPSAQSTGDPGDFATAWSQQGLRVARLFSEVSLAMGDAAIAAWDQKYRTPIDLWRPYHAVREAGTDNNPDTHADVSWEPLSADRNDDPFSPCFPAWVSGHATFGGAWGQMMVEEFSGADATDPFPLTLTTQDPHSQTGVDGNGDPIFVEREFDSFLDAAEENARSRIYLGVHYRVDMDDGLATGYAVAENVADNFLRWNKTCPNWSCVEKLPSPSQRLAAGYHHSLAVRPDGTVGAWGRWLLGNGSFNDNSTSPVTVGSLSNVAAVAAGEYHSLALRGDGTVWAWGGNGLGELGDGTTTDRATPVQVTGLTNVRAIAAGDAFSMALKRDGTVWAWGDNGSGQLGTGGTPASSNVPIQVTGVSGVTALAAYQNHTFVVTSDGTVWAWGRNLNGALGDGTTVDRNAPGQVPDVSGAVSVAAGRWHGAALLSDGTVWHWGAASLSGDPEEVDDIDDVVAIAAGPRHTTAIKTDGTVWAWGDAPNEVLGSSTTPTTIYEPVQVDDLTRVTAITSGGPELSFEYGHSFATRADRGTWAWGEDVNGQLGIGGTGQNVFATPLFGFQT